MRKDFNDTRFLVILPEIELTEDQCIITFRTTAKMSTQGAIVRVMDCTFTDYLYRKFPAVKIENGNQVLTAACRPETRIHISREKQKFGLRNAKLRLCIQEKMSQLTHTITYKVTDHNKCMLESVDSKPLSAAEKEEFEQFMERVSRERETNQKNVNSVRAGESAHITGAAPGKTPYHSGNSLRNPSETDFEQHRSSSERSQPRKFVDPFCERYEQALDAEIKYAKENGSQNYRVINGRLITPGKKKEYAYIFDMENEVRLAESQPVSLQVGEETVPGELLLCEDFKLVVIVKKDLGEKVPIATITSELWKLLVYLKERLEKYQECSRDSIARTLVQNGPRLGNQSEFTRIKRGQENAIKFAKKNKITMIWGPPGTGKTYTMSKLAIDFMKQGKKVLILSHSNVSVDGVIKRIVNLLSVEERKYYLGRGKILRYGYVRDEALNRHNYATSANYVMQRLPDVMSEKNELEEEKVKRKNSSGRYSERDVEIDSRLKEIRLQMTDFYKNVVTKADILATNISKTMIDKVFEDSYYDVVMFDEASMAYVPHIVSAAMMARQHFICVGDFMQLSPIAQGPAKAELEQDIFSFLNIVDRNGTLYDHDWIVMLDVQRRMHPKIAGYSNQYVYHGMLKNSEEIKEKTETITKLAPFKNSAVTMLNLSGTYCASMRTSEHSRFNLFSAFVSFYTALRLEQETKGTVAVISPYAAQTRLIRAMILDYRKKQETKVICSTVHQFQGSECDSVIFDAVESYPSLKPGWLMMKNVNYKVLRLMNVAVTRAKSKLITVCNLGYWERKIGRLEHPMNELLEYEQQVGTVMEDEELQHHLVNDHKLQLNESARSDDILRFYGSTQDYDSTLLNDILSARKEITMTIPDGSFDLISNEKLLHYLELAKERKVLVRIAVRNYDALPEAWKYHCIRNDEVILPLILIDKKIVWYGVPATKAAFMDKDMKFNTTHSYAVRFVGAHVAAMTASFSSIDRLMAKYQKKYQNSENSYVQRKSLGQQKITNSGREQQKAENKTAESHKAEHERAKRESTEYKSPEHDRAEHLRAGYQKTYDTDFSEETGLKRFISSRYRCRICKSPMKLLRGRSGKCYLQCSVCEHRDFLRVDTINDYIYRENVRCQEHNCRIEGKLGPDGVYVECDGGGGHQMKPDEI